MILCEKCVKKASKVISPLGQASAQQLPTPRQVGRPKLSKQLERVEEVVDNYAEVIREARERASLTRDALAAMLGVKVSVLRRIEEGTLVPTVELARKIEKTLKVRLFTQVIEERKRGGETRAWEETLGDVVVFKE